MMFACSSADHDTNNFRADVIDCEDALARLTSCCPGFDPGRVQCTYYHDKSHSESGCSSHTIDTYAHETPALSIDESHCVITRTCDDLVAGGVCARAQAAVEYIEESRREQSGGMSFGASGDPSRSTTDSRNQTHPPVCQ